MREHDIVRGIDRFNNVTPRPARNPFRRAVGQGFSAVEQSTRDSGQRFRVRKAQRLGEAGPRVRGQSFKCGFGQRSRQTIDRQSRFIGPQAERDAIDLDDIIGQRQEPR